MQVDLFTLPSPLKFGEGDNAFSIQLRRFTQQERLAVLDAVQSDGAGRISLAQIQRAAGQLVIGLMGVTTIGGERLTLQSIHSEGGGDAEKFDRFLAVLPISRSIDVLAGILAFVGLPRKAVDAIRTAFAWEEGTADPTPTNPPDANTPANASGG